MRDLLIPPPKGGIKRAGGGERVEHHCEGGEVKSDLLSWESKQRVTWNLSPFVFSIPKKTGGNLTCGPSRCGFCTNSYTFFIRNSTNSYNEPRARAARAKPEHTSCPNQAAPGCPDVRVHPAALTLGYTRLPRPLAFRVHPAAPTS